MKIHGLDPTKDFTHQSYLRSMLLLETSHQHKLPGYFEEVLAYESIDQIGVLTPEAKERLRAYVRENPDLEENLGVAIESVRRGSFDMMQVLDTIINPETCFFSDTLTSDLAGIVVGVIESGNPQTLKTKTRISIFVKDPEFGD